MLAIGDETADQIRSLLLGLMLSYDDSISTSQGPAHPRLGDLTVDHGTSSFLGDLVADGRE